MRYRIQFTVGIGRLAAIIEAVCKDNPEPELMIEPIEPPKVRKGYEAKPKVPRKGPVPKANSKRATGGLRQETLFAALKTGPKRWSELKVALSAEGLSESSLNNIVGKLQKDGIIRRGPEGLWNLVEHDKTGTA